MRVILKSVRVQVLYFGVVRDLLGCEREALELTDGARVEDAIRLLRSRTSNLEDRVWTSMAVAVNLEYASTLTVLYEGDEVALLPPVSGGIDWMYAERIL